MKYTFPFNTCEIPTKGTIEQPISTYINMLSSIILIILFFVAKNVYVKIAIFFYTIFEIWHTFSHMKHIDGKIQKYVVHVLGITMGIMTLIVIQKLSNSTIELHYLLILSILLILDIVLLFKYKNDDLVGFILGLVIILWIVIGKWKYIPKDIQINLRWIIIGVLILILLFINEAYNCEKMQKWKKLPYHAIIEILGLILFTGLSLTWIKWEQK